MQHHSLVDSKNGRLFLFGFLYFVQGAMLAYVLVFNNLYLRNFGASAQQLSLLNGLLVVPFILKVGVGILSDKVALNLRAVGRGNRVPYISIGFALITVGGIVGAFVPPVERYPLFVMVALLIAFGLAIFDTVADGFAIDVTPTDQQRQVQGAMVIGRAFGLVILSAVYGRVIQLLGWQVIFFFVAFVTFFSQLLLRFVREPAVRSPAQTFAWEAIPQLWRPEIRLFGLYAIVYSVTIYGANAIITLFTNEELGGTMVQIGDVAALGGLGTMAGGFLSMLLARRISIWRQGVYAATAVSLALIIFSLTNTLDRITIIFIIWGICFAGAELVYVTLAMQKADPRMGAGQFAIFMAVSNTGIGIGQSITTGLIDTVSFQWIFAALAFFNIFALILLRAMRVNAEKTAVVPAATPSD